MGEVSIESDVTGAVWKILVEVGSSVAAGDPLLIMESMKMEIPIESTVAGTVSAMMVQQEDVVEEGQIVAVIATG